MACGAELSDFVKGIIVSCDLSGLSSRAIAVKLNRSKSTVSFILRKWKIDGHCDNGERCRRPKILTNRDRRTLKRETVYKRAQPMATIRQEFQAATGVSVFIGTLRTEVHQFGCSGRAPAHKPHITKRNKEETWYLDHSNWTFKQWKLVLWSNESRFTLFRSDGRVWVWRLPSERLLQSV